LGFLNAGPAPPSTQQDPNETPTKRRRDPDQTSRDPEETSTSSPAPLGMIGFQGCSRIRGLGASYFCRILMNLGWVAGVSAGSRLSLFAGSSGGLSSGLRSRLEPDLSWGWGRQNWGRGWGRFFQTQNAGCEPRSSPLCPAYSPAMHQLSPGHPSGAPLSAYNTPLKQGLQQPAQGLRRK
jgi:hypothetical protein